MEDTNCLYLNSDESIFHEYIDDSSESSDFAHYTSEEERQTILMRQDSSTGTVSSQQSLSSFFSPSNFINRIKRVDFLVVYSSLLILSILLLVIVFFGENTPWYKNLIISGLNPWFVRVLWIIGTVLSYVAFLFIWQDVRIHEVPRDLIVSVLFIITGFLFVAWGVALYYAENIVLSLWVSLIIFIYNLWLFIYVWHIKPIAAIFLIPNLILYIYLLYSTLHIASLNHVPI